MPSSISPPRVDGGDEGGQGHDRRRSSRGLVKRCDRVLHQVDALPVAAARDSGIAWCALCSSMASRVSSGMSWNATPCVYTLPYALSWRCGA